MSTLTDTEIEADKNAHEARQQPVESLTFTTPKPKMKWSATAQPANPDKRVLKARLNASEVFIDGPQYNTYVPLDELQATIDLLTFAQRALSKRDELEAEYARKLAA